MAAKCNVLSWVRSWPRFKRKKKGSLVEQLVKYGKDNSTVLMLIFWF